MLRSRFSYANETLPASGAPGGDLRVLLCTAAAGPGPAVAGRRTPQPAGDSTMLPATPRPGSGIWFGGGPTIAATGAAIVRRVSAKVSVFTAAASASDRQRGSMCV